MKRKDIIDDEGISPRDLFEMCCYDHKGKKMHQMEAQGYRRFNHVGRAGTGQCPSKVKSQGNKGIM